jgi:hypothetical protein
LHKLLGDLLAFEITTIKVVSFEDFIALYEAFLQGGKLFGAMRKKRNWRERTSVQTRASSKRKVRRSGAAEMRKYEKEVDQSYEVE